MKSAARCVAIDRNNWPRSERKGDAYAESTWRESTTRADDTMAHGADTCGRRVVCVADHVFHGGSVGRVTEWMGILKGDRRLGRVPQRSVCRRERGRVADRSALEIACRGVGSRRRRVECRRRRRTIRSLSAAARRDGAVVGFAGPDTRGVADGDRLRGDVGVSVAAVTGVGRATGNRAVIAECSAGI